MTASESLIRLFSSHFGEEPTTVQPLPASGSSRQYFRLVGSTHIAIGVWNADDAENRAFVEFDKHFRQYGVPVPEIFAVDLASHIYLQEDLGDTDLLSALLRERSSGSMPQNVMDLYRQSLQHLAKMQTVAAKELDFGNCYPRAAFDRQSIQWDLNYFKYYCLKLSGFSFDEQALEDDFERFAQILLKYPSDYFMFRDFQARNIMVKGGKVYFIDFQGGRKGALAYDVASLLWQAKANISEEDRESLLEYYMEQVAEYVPINRNEFVLEYTYFVYARTLQVLGAYGYRGLFERKPHFISSIPFALENLSWLLERYPLPDTLPTLRKVLPQLLTAKALTQAFPRPNPDAPLVVSVCSFSYRQGYPSDDSGHGGGFVFDCRAIHNPGRYEPYKKLTGRDAPVMEFLKKETEMESFLNEVYAMVGRSVQVYLDRGFDHLSVAFGCTGGQHRSVFAADSLAKYLHSQYGVKVELRHIEQEKKNWINE